MKIGDFVGVVIGSDTYRGIILKITPKTIVVNYLGKPKRFYYVIRKCNYRLGSKHITKEEHYVNGYHYLDFKNTETELDPNF